LLQASAPVRQAIGPATRHGAAALDQLINRQAQIIAYNDDFKLMMLTSVPTILLLFLLRRPKAVAPSRDHPAVID
jgi:DHA2 family multidrug resistance protein